MSLALAASRRGRRLAPRSVTVAWTSAAPWTCAGVSKRYHAGSTPDIVDISGHPLDAGSQPQDALLAGEELRQFVKHPEMTSLEVNAAAGSATLRHQQVSISIPTGDLKERLQTWGWEGRNCHRPLMVFGDDQSTVRKAYAMLQEEGFTAVRNAQTREAIVAALRRPTAHFRGAAGGTADASKAAEATE